MRYVMYMQTMEFDFVQYIELRKGLKKAQAREGVAYAFAPDLRMLRRTKQLKPVEMAMEEASKRFRQHIFPALLDRSERCTPEVHGQVYAAMAECAEKLHVRPYPVYITKQAEENVAFTVGFGEDAHTFLPQSLLAKLSAQDLLHVLGGECGRVQNGHTPLRTALFYATHHAQGLARFAVAPAKALLLVWLRRADITADRAGLLCTRSVEASEHALAALKPGLDSMECSRRTLALQHFANSRYFCSLLGQPGGETKEFCDDAVAELFDHPLPKKERA